MKLYKMSQNKYLVVCADQGICNMLNVVEMTALMADLGVEIEELSYVLAEFVRRNHNMADFGINGMWTFTAYIHITEEKAA